MGNMQQQQRRQQAGGPGDEEAAAADVEARGAALCAQLEEALGEYGTRDAAGAEEWEREEWPRLREAVEAQTDAVVQRARSAANGWSVMHCAIRYCRKEEQLRYLMDRCARRMGQQTPDPFEVMGWQATDGSTPIMGAAFNPHIPAETFMWLADDAGENLTATDNEGYALLHKLVFRLCTDTLAPLTEEQKDAMVQNICTVGILAGRGALDHADAYGHTPRMQLEDGGETGHVALERVDALVLDDFPADHDDDEGGA